MKKLSLMNFKAENIAVFKEIEFVPNGENVYITGQNGAGKSTIKKAINWILSGNTSEGEKLIPYDGSGLPLVEIGISDGNITAKLAKEIEERTSKGKISRTAKCYLNGLPVTQKDLTEFFNQYVPADILQIMLNPFDFFTQVVESKRRLTLVQLFGNVSDEEVLASDESFKELDLKGLNVYDYLKYQVNAKKKYQRGATEIPMQIKVLRSQIKEIEDERGSLNYQIMELESQKAEIEKQLESWQGKVKELRDRKKRLSEVNAKIYELRKSEEMIQEQIRINNRRREELIEKWNVCVNSTCPTCGQKIGGTHEGEVKKQVSDKGKVVTQSLKTLQNDLIAVRKKLANWDAFAKDLIATTETGDEYEEFNTLSQQRDALSKAIRELEKKQAAIEVQMKINEENQRQIDSLTEQERNIGKKIAEVEKQEALAEKFISRKMELTTDAINAHFEHISWQMFETQKSGEVKGVCTATLNGVPYELISKGEKMKCALDVVNALQNYFEVVMPLIIDDAESYTSNSLPSLQNQLIVLSVQEGQDLDIEIYSGEEGRETA